MCDVVSTQGESSGAPSSPSSDSSDGSDGTSASPSPPAANGDKEPDNDDSAAAQQGSMVLAIVSLSVVIGVGFT